MALFAWPLSRAPKWFRKGFNWHRLEVSGIVTFMFKKQASSFFIQYFVPFSLSPSSHPGIFLYIISPCFMKHHSVFNGKPSLLWETLDFRVRKGRRRRNPILTTHRITCVETDKELWKSLTGIIILPPILRRNHEKSTHFFVSFARDHSITQYFRIGFLFHLPVTHCLGAGVI